MNLTRALLLPIFDLENIHQNKIPRLIDILENLYKANTKEIVLFNNLNKEYTDTLTYLPIISKLQSYNVTIITKGQVPLYLSTLNATIIDLEKEYTEYRNTSSAYKSYSMLSTQTPREIVKKEDLIADKSEQIGFLKDGLLDILTIKETQTPYIVDTSISSNEGLLDNLMEGGLLDGLMDDDGLLDNLDLDTPNEHPITQSQTNVEQPSTLADSTQILLALALKSKQKKKETTKKTEPQTNNQYVNTLMALVNHTNSKNKKQNAKTQKKSKTKSTSISKTLTYEEYIIVKTKEILQDLKLVIDVNKQSPILTELKKLIPKQVIKIQIDAQECKVTLAGNKIKASYINMEGVI